jgi:hypothetical protein
LSLCVATVTTLTTQLKLGSRFGGVQYGKRARAIYIPESAIFRMVNVLQLTRSTKASSTNVEAIDKGEGNTDEGATGKDGGDAGEAEVLMMTCFYVGKWTV